MRAVDRMKSAQQDIEREPVHKFAQRYTESPNLKIITLLSLYLNVKNKYMQQEIRWDMSLRLRNLDHYPWCRMKYNYIKQNSCTVHALITLGLVPGFSEHSHCGQPFLSAVLSCTRDPTGQRHNGHRGRSAEH